MRSAFFVLLISVGLLSCSKDEVNPPFDPSSMWNAHQEKEWDSVAVARQLQGQWKWVYNYCCPEGAKQKGSNTEGEGLYIRFYEDSRLEVYKNDKLIQESSWSLYLKDGENLYGLKLEPAVSQLYGRILFKKDYVLFNNSYIDGEDNFFVKTSLLD